MTDISLFTSWQTSQYRAGNQQGAFIPEGISRGDWIATTGAFQNQATTKGALEMRASENQVL